MSQLESNKPNIVLDEPVFITGIARSGTSLLYRCLLSHSHFKPELNDNTVKLTVESKVFLQFENIYNSDNAEWYMVRNHDIKNQFLKSVANAKYYQKIGNFPYQILRKHSSSRTLRQIAFKLGLNHIVLRKYFYYAQEARKVLRIIEKTPDHIRQIPEIRATFSNAKIIFLYRHPIDVLSSVRKRKKRTEQSGREVKSWLKISIEDFCGNYESLVKIALNEMQNDGGKQFMLLKYEDLTSHVDENFQKICDFISIPFEEQMIPQSKKTKKNDLAGLSGGEIVTKTKNWEDFLCRRDAQAVETKLSDLMKELNYEKYT